jgi:hypothetical protein
VGHLPMLEVPGAVTLLINAHLAKCTTRDL